MCDDLMGIDSFRIFENKKCFAIRREDYFSFNNYDESCERTLKIKLNDDEFCFYVIEDGRELIADLFEDGVHVAFKEFFLNSSVGFPRMQSENLTKFW